MLKKSFWLLCGKLCVCVCAHSFSHVQLIVTPRTVARQVPLSIGFSRQEYWSEQPFPSPGDLPDPGMEPMSLVSPALVGGFFTTELPEKPKVGKCRNRAIKRLLQ